MKIYLSPSTQERNAYATGQTEEAVMRDLAVKVSQRLFAHEVRIGGAVSANANAIDSNGWGAELHVALHSNAGGGEGTLVLSSGSVRSLQLANAIYALLAPVSVGNPDDGVRVSRQFVELTGTKAPAVIVEVEFHDSVQGATHITQNLDAYADAIAKGILAVAGPGTPQAPKPVLTRTLRYRIPRMRGSDVAAVQRKVGAVADGIFGTATRDKVRAFQRSRGLVADGIVGPATARALGFDWRQ